MSSQLERVTQEGGVGPQSVLVVDDVKRWFPQRKGLFSLFTGPSVFVKAVDGVSFVLPEGETLGLIGESGCGKSTIGKVLVGLDQPTGGRILFQGQEAGALLKSNPLAFRRKAQIVFQNPFDTFDPRHTIYSILSEPLKIHGIGSSDKERREICAESLEKSSLSPAEDYLGRYPHELSGGQLQRISIIRSMLLKPTFMVADEPVSMLDVSVRAEILNALLQLSSEFSTSVIFISHDISVTRYVSQRIAVMYLGRIVEIGDADEVLSHPAHPYTQALISNFPSTDPTLRREGMEIQGEPPTPINPGPGCYFAPRCPMAMGECQESYPGSTDLGSGHIAWCHRLNS